MDSKEKNTLRLDVAFILVDIEGTTTSISFVKDFLFPFARTRLKEHVDKFWSESEFKEDLTLLKQQFKEDLNNNVSGVIPILDGNDEVARKSVIDNVLWQMDIDRKATALKSLQGHIWRRGYEAGHIKGHIYDDVEPCLKRWTSQGKSICVYSSGSVEAQKLLFGNTEKGNLLPLFSNYFDTTVGIKIESSSYTRIAEELKCQPKDVLFLTDIPREAKAATTAGMQAVLVSRPGNNPLTQEDQQDFLVIHNFNELSIL